MDFIADIFFSLLGRIILFLRYRDSNRMRQELAEKYDNSYSQAGRLFSTLTITRIMLFAFAALLIAVLYGILRHNLGLI